MKWKRVVLSIGFGILIMGADLVGLMVINKLYRPQHPPAWVTHSCYYFLAWPLSFTSLIFHRASGDTTHGPTFLAVVAAGLFDLILFTVLTYALLSWSARRKAHV